MVKFQLTNTAVNKKFIHNDFESFITEKGESKRHKMLVSKIISSKEEGRREHLDSIPSPPNSNHLPLSDCKRAKKNTYPAKRGKEGTHSTHPPLFKSNLA